MAVWTWAPASITENSENFFEIITRSESGYEKRRIKSSRPLWSGEYNYFNRNNVERYAMLEFLQERMGPHEWFYLPSFMWDSYLTVLYTSGTQLTVYSNSKFDVPFNTFGRSYIWLINSDGENEVATISSLSGSTIINITSALTYDYPVGSEVDICYKARLDEAKVTFQDLSYFKHDISIPFTEVK